MGPRAGGPKLQWGAQGAAVGELAGRVPGARV